MCSKGAGFLSEGGDLVREAALRMQTADTDALIDGAGALSKYDFNHKHSPI